MLGEAAAGKVRVLVVDDDSALAEMLAIALTRQGFHAQVCNSGETALTTFRSYHPDIVLLDLMLPGMDGVSVCRLLRSESGVPIVMLTAKGETKDVVLGLEAGADDYVPKPFHTSELIARIKARLRHHPDPNSGPLVAGDLVIDPVAHAVLRDGVELALTPLEFDLLTCLAKKPNQVFTREQLLEQVWGYRHAADTRLVNVHVQRLRAKVELDPDNPKIVQTVRGVGYKTGPIE